MLRSQLRIRLPAGIEQHKDRSNLMLVGDRQECVDPLLKSGRVLLPQQIVQEHAHRIHADGLRPAQFLVDLLRIKRCRLPHFQLIDGIPRDVIRTDWPGLLGVPGIRLGFAPARGLVPGGAWLIGRCTILAGRGIRLCNPNDGRQQEKR